MGGLAPKYSGPWIITAEKGNSTYAFLNTDGQVEEAVAVVQLKKLVTGMDPGRRGAETIEGSERMRTS